MKGTWGKSADSLENFFQEPSSWHEENYLMEISNLVVEDKEEEEEKKEKKETTSSHKGPQLFDDH